MNEEEMTQLLYEALETEKGGVQIYETAIQCAVNRELKKEWQEYLEQTRNHEQILTRAFETLGLDPGLETPGRKVVRHQGESLVQAMKMAKQAGKPAAAQLVAAECVVLAETKDHMNWQLIGMLAGEVKGDQGKVFREAYKEVEDQEDEHLYHTKGWARELWVESLGMEAVLPPPEEEKEVKDAISAARAAKSREKMLSRR